MTKIWQWLRLCLTAACVALLLAGCAKKTTDDDEDLDTPQTKKKAAGGVALSATKTPVEAPSFGPLRGTVTFDGDRSAFPMPANLVSQMDAQADKKICCMGDTANYSWKIGEKGGLANVVVWLRPPDGKFFPKPPDDRKTWSDELRLDQPYCTFEPHVSVAYPSHFDPESKKQVSNNQKFLVLNSAPVLHNTRYQGNPLKYSGDSKNLPAKQGDLVSTIEIPLKPDDSYPITLNCDVHKWMKAYVWAFDHPYAAVTKQDGTFEIPNAPLDTDLNIVAWHESAGFINGPKGTPVKLKEGQPQNFTVKAK